MCDGRGAASEVEALPFESLASQSARGVRFVTTLHKTGCLVVILPPSLPPFPPLSTEVSHIWKVYTKLYRALKYFPLAKLIQREMRFYSFNLLFSVQ